MKLRAICTILTIFLGGGVVYGVENDAQEKAKYVRGLLHQMPDVSREEANTMSLEFRSGSHSAVKSAKYGFEFLYKYKIIMYGFELFQEKKSEKKEKQQKKEKQERCYGAVQDAIQYMICAHEMGHHYARWLTCGVDGLGSMIFSMLLRDKLATVLSSQVSRECLAYIENSCGSGVPVHALTGVATFGITLGLLPIFTFPYDYWNEWQADQFALQQARDKEDIRIFKDSFLRGAKAYKQLGYMSWLMRLFDCHPHPKKQADLCQEYLNDRISRHHTLKLYNHLDL